MWRRILGAKEPLQSPANAKHELQDVSGPPDSVTQDSQQPIEFDMTDYQVKQPKADIGKQQIGSVYAKAFLGAVENDADPVAFGFLPGGVHGSDRRDVDAVDEDQPVPRS